MEIQYKNMECFKVWAIKHNRAKKINLWQETPQTIKNQVQRAPKQIHIRRLVPDF